MKPEDLARLRTEYQHIRQEAIENYRQTLKADMLLSTLRRCADQTLTKLLALCPLPKGAALAAVGGYGRGELYPFSDVDVLILLERDPDPEEESALGVLVTAMWDLGLEPGYSVRTIDQCIAEAAGDITVETSMLETRWIAGSKKLIQTFIAAMKAHLDPYKFFRQNAQKCSNAMLAIKTLPTHWNQTAKSHLVGCVIYK